MLGSSAAAKGSWEEESRSGNWNEAVTHSLTFRHVGKGGKQQKEKCGQRGGGSSAPWV